MGVRATVKDGRLLVDVETSLPEGTVVDLVLDDEGDALDEVERRALARALDRGLDEARDGHVSSPETVLDRLRARRG